VPARVAVSAASQDCTALGELPEDYEQIQPWLVSLAPYTGGADDSAFLCRTRGSEPRLLLVLDVTSADDPWQSCESRIRLTTQFDPEGLAIVEPGDPVHFAQVPLDEWRARSGGYGPAGAMPAAPMLDTSQGIAGWVFYCHEGRWLALFVH
jgi:hypothetical protein